MNYWWKTKHPKLIGSCSWYFFSLLIFELKQIAMRLTLYNGQQHEVPMHRCLEWHSQGKLWKSMRSIWTCSRNWFAFIGLVIGFLQWLLTLFCSWCNLQRETNRLMTSWEIPVQQFLICIFLFCPILDEPLLCGLHITDYICFSWELLFYYRIYSNKCPTSN